MTSPQSDLLLAPGEFALVRARGSDATRFLNDLISQRVDDMDVGTARRSFLLAPQGKLQHLFWVIRRAEGLDMLVEDRSGEDLASDLRRYVIRVDVSLEVESVQLEVGDVSGPDVSWSQLPRGVVRGDSGIGDTMPEDDYHRLRILSGEPQWAVDVGPETMPHETGLVASAVDFTKGCYLGQELVARVDSRGGSAPRRLCLVESGDGDLKLGAELSFQGKTVGSVTSVSTRLGLALVHRSVPDNATVDAGTVTAAIRTAHPNPGT